ncbi:MAG: hypothetical protein LQ345_003751, partial [Seirophora villosa]
EASHTTASAPPPLPPSQPPYPAPPATKTVFTCSRASSPSPPASPGTPPPSPKSLTQGMHASDRSNTSLVIRSTTLSTLHCLLISIVFFAVIIVIVFDSVYAFAPLPTNVDAFVTASRFCVYAVYLFGRDSRGRGGSSELTQRMCLYRKGGISIGRGVVARERVWFGLLNISILF